MTDLLITLLWKFNKTVRFLTEVCDRNDWIWKYKTESQFVSYSTAKNISLMRADELASEEEGLRERERNIEKL